MNVIVYDVLNGGYAAAYKPIKVWKGMTPIDPEWTGNNDGNDLTWLIWVIMAIVALIVVVTMIIFVIKKKGYN